MKRGYPSNNDGRKFDPINMRTADERREWNSILDFASFSFENQLREIDIFFELECGSLTRELFKFDWKSTHRVIIS